MDKFLDKLVERHLGILMNESRDKLALSDKLYKQDLKDSKELEKSYNAIPLDDKARILINDYIACLMTREHRMSEISYLAGIGDTIKFLNAIGVLKGSRKNCKKLLKRILSS